MVLSWDRRAFCIGEAGQFFGLITERGIQRRKTAAGKDQQTSSSYSALFAGGRGQTARGWIRN